MTDYKHEVRRPTDYNDSDDWNNGKIHGWNGGDCPVHPETVVKFWTNYGCKYQNQAKCLRWNHTDEGLGDIIAFQVVKEYVGPKVIWVNEYGGIYVVYDDEGEARKNAQRPATRIAVKYVEAIADAKEVKE